MAKNPDWIPRKISLFIPFGNNFTLVATANGVAWKLITADVATLGTQNTATAGFYAISSVKESSTPKDKKNTTKAIKAQKKTMRLIGIGQMKYNALMTDEDRTSCGVVNDSGTHTLSPVANVAPIAVITRTGILGAKVNFTDPVSLLGGKPAGQDGQSIAFGFYAPGTTPPLEVDCTQTIVFSKNIGFVVFAPANLNKLFIGYVRYKNTRNILGTVASQVFGV